MSAFDSAIANAQTELNRLTALKALDAEAERMYKQLGVYLNSTAPAMVALEKFQSELLRLRFTE